MTFEKIAKILAKHLECDISDIKTNSKFSDFGLDSLDTVEVLMNMEEEFGIEFDISETDQTLDDLVKYIDAKAC